MRRLPGSHPANIRNRSSKHLNGLCGPGHKPFYRCMSNAWLKELSKPVGPNGKRDWAAQKELDRREKKRAKQAAKA